MTRPADRLVEVGLAEVVGGRVPPDLAPRVLLAWRVQRSARRRRRHLALAAAVVLVAAGGLLLGRGGRSSGPATPTAVASRALAVLGADGEARTDRRLRAGDRLLLMDEGARLALPDGGRVDLAAASLLVLGARAGGASLDLRAGRARIDVPPTSAVRVRTPLGEVQVPGGARCRIEVPTPAGTSGAAFSALARRWLGGRPHAPSLLVASERGGAVVGTRRVPRGSLLLRLARGAEKQGPDPDAAARTRLRSLLAAAAVGEADVDVSDPRELERLKAASEAQGELRRRIGEDVRARAWLLGHLVALPDAARHRDLRAAFAELLLADPEQLAEAGLEALVEAEPGLLSEDALVRLAQRGSAAALQALHREMAHPPGYGPVIPALLLALRGDDAGRAVLRDACAFGATFPFLPDRVLAAAAGLQLLGDPSPWRAARDRVVRQVERLLDGNDFTRARWLTLRAEYFRRAARGQEIPLGGRDPVGAYVARHVDSIPDAAALRRRLKDL
jgi:hypothetical protein